MVQVEVRTQRNIAGFQVIEAIRAHAAANNELPKSLDDITVVPVPLNPMTQEPFEYAVNNGAGELKVFGGNPSTVRFYRLRLAQ